MGILSTSGEDEFRFKGEGNTKLCMCDGRKREEEEDGCCMIIRRVEKK